MARATKARVVKTRAEFDAVMDCQWAGFAEPREEFWSLWFPTDIGAHVGHELKRNEAMAESKDRMWSDHCSNPHSTWIYVAEDIQQGSSEDVPYVAASCQWRTYEKPLNPYAGGIPDIKCVAWPVESMGAKFAEKLSKGILMPRVNKFAQPHLGLSWMAVRPEWRQRGLGGMLMQWGVDRADVLELEGYIEASDLGKLLYEKYGFREVGEYQPDMSPPVGVTAKDIEEWRALEKYYLPRGYHMHSMWRPERGDWNRVTDEDWKKWSS